MAVDEALLAGAADEGLASLRFYQWSEPTLSLGYFQRVEDRRLHPASVGCAVVRRQTGGGAILHDRELTYSLALPADHPFAGSSGQLYQGVHAAFVATLERLNIVSSNRSFEICKGQLAPSPDGEPFLCFQRRARGDVLLTNAPGNGANQVKILGSAQRRRRGAILQHGSMLLERSPAAPELAGIIDVTGARISLGQLAADVSERLANSLQLTLSNACLPLAQVNLARALVAEKYDSPSWTKRR
jgi:lipoate-protein ligase A